MAEIIEEPSALSKIIPVSFKINDTDSVATTRLATKKQFNTTDTDAWLSFILDGIDANMTGEFDLTMVNVDENPSSIINRTNLPFSAIPFHYKIDASADVEKNQIRHAGRWIGQVIIRLANGDTTTRQFDFAIVGHLLDGKEARLILIEDYNALMATITTSKDELAQYNIDYAALIDTVTTQEAARVQAELTRSQTFDALVEGEMIAQEVATKLTEKEATFAPRILSVEQQLEQTVVKADTAAQKADAMASGSPKGVYDTLALLQDAYPTGTTGAYLVKADGQWYYWSDSAWTAGGVYQANVTSPSVIKNKTFASAEARMEEIETDLIFPMKNLTVNGDFSNETTGWTVSAATGFSVVGGVAEFTPTAVSGRARAALTTTVGNLIYRGALVKATRTNVGLSSGSIPQVRHSGSGNFEWLSCLRVASAVSELTVIVDDGTSGWAKIYLDNVVTVDLTDTFGVGNEPTLTEFDALLTKLFTNKYFDGVKNTFRSKDLYTVITDVKALQDSLSAPDESRLTALENNLYYPIENKTINGDFSNGTTEWTLTSGTGFVVIDGVAEYLPTAQYGRCKSVFDTAVGNIIYRGTLVKSTSALVGISSGTLPAVYHTGSGNFEWLSYTRAASSISESSFVTDARTSGWDKIYFDNVVTVDLTATFGSGNEPTTAEVDALLTKLFANKYFSGSANTFRAVDLYTAISDIKKLQTDVANVKAKVEICLPAKLVAVVGHEFNVYTDNVVLCDNINNYETRWSISGGNIGVQYSDYYRLTPTADQIGIRTLTLMVRDSNDGLVIATASTTLHIIADTALPALKTIFIGDSLTDVGYYPAEVVALGNGSITSLGSRTAQATNHEGRSGWATYDYTNRADYLGSTNAFWNPTTLAFDFAYYMTQQAYTDVDVVFLNLGTNGVSDISGTEAALDIMIASIHAYDPTIKILVSLIAPPASQDGWGYKVGLGTSKEFKRNAFNLVKSYIEKYENKTNIDVTPVYINLDCKNDYNTLQVPLSSRNPTTTAMQTNNVHPSTYGYLKFADVYYNSIQFLF